MVLSSFLAYYSSPAAAAPSAKTSNAHALRRRLVGALAVLLRRLGKALATLNAVWIVAACVFQFSGFFDRCYCNSSVLGLGKGAYNTIRLDEADIGTMRSAWIGGACVHSFPWGPVLTLGIFSALVLSLGSATIFEGELLERMVSVSDVG